MRARTCELRLRPCERRVGAPAAWWLVGRGAAGVVAELCDWPVPSSLVRVLRVAPGGWLAFVEGRPLPDRPHLIPLRRRAGLWLPMDGELTPVVTDAELAELLDEQLGGGRALWLPSTGLRRAREEDITGLEALLARPESSGEDWSRACDPLPATPELRELVPNRRVDLRALLAAGRGDIGQSTEPPEARDSAESEGESDEESGPEGAQRRRREPSGGADTKASGRPAEAERADERAGETRAESPAVESGPPPSGGLLRGVARGVKWFTDKAPRTADEATWVDRLSGWADGVLEAGGALGRRARESLESLRNRRRDSLEDLLRLLEEDPDEGLRRAIPLGGDEAARGTPEVPASADLPDRDPIFSLDRLQGRGAGAAESWDASERLQARLRESYRAAARRELRLGRYRRAAYIFGELLGEDFEAARALEAGGCHGEAAVIYESRLGSPRDALRCYRAAGRYEEALAHAVRLGDHLVAAELCELLERPEEARTHLRQAAVQLQSQGAPLRAAELYERRLGEVDEALAVLRGGWPHGPAATACLKAGLELLARHDREDEAAAEVARVADDPGIDGDRALIVAETLTALVVEGRDGALRAECRDATQRIAGRRLAAAGRKEAELLAGLLARLDAGDRLLQRDSRRYVERRRRAGPRARRRVRLVRTLSLPHEVVWSKAIAVDGAVVAGGIGPFGPVAARLDELGGLRTVRWDLEPKPDPDGALRLRPEILCQDSAAYGAVLGSSIAWILPRYPILDMKRLDTTLEIGTPYDFMDDTLALCESRGGHQWRARTGYGGELVIEGRSPRGRIDEYTLRDAPDPPEEASGGALAGLLSRRTGLGLYPPRLASLGATVVVTDRSDLFRLVGPGTFERVALPGLVTSLAVSHETVQCTVAVALRERFGVLTGRDGAGGFESLSANLESAKLAFTRGGDLVAVSKRRMEVFRRGGEGWTRIDSRDEGRHDALDVVPGAGADSVCVLDAGGLVSIYETR